MELHRPPHLIDLDGKARITTRCSAIKGFPVIYLPFADHQVQKWEAERILASRPPERNRARDHFGD